MNSPRTPGTFARFLLLLAAVAFASLLLATGFPPGSPDRLPVFLIAVALAVLAAARPTAAIALLAFLFPCAGLLARAAGGTEPAMWPGMLLGGLLAGWCFRFLYDFESRPEPASPDAPLGALLAVWVLATGVAAARAATLWAAVRGLWGRAVNSQGLPAGIAVRESFFAFAALAGGVAFYFVLRRAGEEARRRAISSVLWGTALSALAAVLQRAGILPGESRPYWGLLGRASGGAVDPNSLGMLCSMALLLAFSRTLRPGRGRAAAILQTLLFAVGLAFSGSRSGALVAGLGLLLLIAAPSLPARARVAAFAGVLAVASATAVAGLAGGGNLSARILQSFDPGVSAEYRFSSRPLLWRAAGRLFAEHPLVGAGVGAFAWRFPDLFEAGAPPGAARDNPGSGYIEALAETGAVGFAVTVVAAAALAVEAFRRWRGAGDDPVRAASGSAVIAFLAALAIGSHWLAGDASLFFFLVAAYAASGGDAHAASGGEGRRAAAPGPETAGRGIRRALAAGVAVYAVGAIAAVLSTGSAAETFRYSPRIGFHEIERGPGGAYRWTRPRFAIWAVPGDPPLRLGLAHFGPSSAPVTLDVRVRGRLVARRLLGAGAATAFTITPGAEPSAVTFALDRAFVPWRLGLSSDRRRLGVLSTSSSDTDR